MSNGVEDIRLSLDEEKRINQRISAIENEHVRLGMGMKTDRTYKHDYIAYNEVLAQKLRQPEDDIYSKWSSFYEDDYENDNLEYRKLPPSYKNTMLPAIEKMKGLGFFKEGRVAAIAGSFEGGHKVAIPAAAPYANVLLG